MEFPEGCPTSSVFQNVSFSCFMSPRLKTSDIVFNTEFYRAHPLIECARVYSLSRSPRISIIVYSLHAQFQTQIPDKCEAHMRFVDSFIYEARMSSALNGSSVIWRFEGSDAIEIRDGITFDFYTGLPRARPSL